MSALPAVRGLIAEIDAVSRPARTFTGDFYFTHRADDRTWIALGDVAGKGLPAAVVMAMIQEELELRIASCARTACDPATTLTRLHEFLRPLMPRNRFVTAVIGNLRPDGRLTIANGGHCPPLIVRANGEIEEIASTGPVVGILPFATWRSTTTHLGDGDALVLYSDGITESAIDGEELGVCGLRRILRGTTDARAILDAVSRYAHDDDRTIVVVRRA
jgi:sigma-B regulation protein RsbU (phosphoserine phosphatase)